MSPETPALELCSVTAHYGKVSALEGLSLAVQPGEVVALLGPNGAGKSTTLRIASGAMRPTTGEVRLNGARVTSLPAHRRARAGVCLVPERRGVFPGLSVLDNLRVASFTGTSLNEIRDSAFERFPRLAERRNQPAGTLSGGEQQMLSMARALGTRPSVLLIDELSMGLAPLIVEELYRHVARIAAEGTPVVVVEQFATVALAIADRAMVLTHGRIAATGTPAEVEPMLASLYLGGRAAD